MVRITLTPFVGQLYHTTIHHHHNQNQEWEVQKAFAVNECAPICAFASLVGIPLGITASAIVLKCVQQQQELKIKVKIKKKKGR